MEGGPSTSGRGICMLVCCCLFRHLLVVKATVDFTCCRSCLVACVADYSVISCCILTILTASARLQIKWLSVWFKAARASGLQACAQQCTVSKYGC